MRSLKRPLCFCLIIASAILITFPTAARGQTREAKQQATGSISGHILLNGKAASGIPVAAYGGDTLARRVAAARTVTDSEGYYSLSQLAPAQYQIATLAPNLTAETGSGPSYGFVSFSRRPHYLRTFYPDVSDQAKAAVIELTEGQEATNIDIKVGSSADSYSVFGRVIDSEGGLPVPGARISLVLNTKDQERSGSFFNGLLTNSRGEFRVDGLGPGRYGAYVSSENEGGTFYSDPAYFEVIDKDVSGVEVKEIRGLSLSGIVVTEGDAQKGWLAQLAGLRASASVMQTSRTQTRGGGSSGAAAD